MSHIMLLIIFKDVTFLNINDVLKLEVPVFIFWHWQACIQNPARAHVKRNMILSH